VDEIAWNGVTACATSCLVSFVAGKISPFLVSVRSGGAGEQSFHTGKGLIEQGDEIVAQGNF